MCDNLSLCDTLGPLVIYKIRKYKLCVCVCVCVCILARANTRVCTCHSMHVEVKGQLPGVGSLPPIWVSGIEVS